MQRFTIVVMLILFSSQLSLGAEKGTGRQQFTAKEYEFFERKIRPILVRRCYECHSSRSKNLKGGLRLDNRRAMLAGGDTGPAFQADEPKNSLLVTAIGYSSDELQMPPSGKLPIRPGPVSS